MLVRTTENTATLNVENVVSLMRSTDYILHKTAGVYVEEPLFLDGTPNPYNKVALSQLPGT